MRYRLFLSLALMLAISTVAVAQTRTDVHPGKVRINSTAADALCVGSSGGASPTCTGGVQSGVLSITGALATASALKVTETGSSSVVGLEFRRTGGTASTWTLFNPGGSTDFYLASGVGNVFTLTAAGALGLSAGITAGSTVTINAAAGSNGYVSKVSGSNKAIFGLTGFIEGDSSTDAAVFAESGLGIFFYTNGSSSQRFSINTTGDWRMGASDHIMDSVGTPTITDHFSGSASDTIAGTDYAFKWTFGSTLDGAGTVTFGHTFSTAPICVVSFGGAPPAVAMRISGTTTTTVSVAGAALNGDSVYVLCRGY
jgi:hypothetical protein